MRTVGIDISCIFRQSASQNISKTNMQNQMKWQLMQRLVR